MAFGSSDRPLLPWEQGWIYFRPGQVVIGVVLLLLVGVAAGYAWCRASEHRRADVYPNPPCAAATLEDDPDGE